MKKLLALLLLASPAFAQTVTMPVTSIWSFPQDQKMSLAATLLRKNALGNLEAIPGQRVALEQMKITYGKTVLVPVWMSATFPGQKTSPMTVAGVRLFHSASGTGWEMPEHPINVQFVAELAVPPGQRVGCTYDMPVGAMGKLSCAVGAAPAPASPPVVTPPPTPTPSKTDDRSPPLTQLVDKDGAVWTLVAGQVLRNGQNMKNPYSPGIAYIYVSQTNTIRSHNSNGTYACWNGTTWAGGGC